MSTKVSQVNAKSKETKWRVPAGEPGGIRGDGTGMRHYTTKPTPPDHNVTTNAARHATGQSLARVGNIRGGQSEPVGNRPITASRTAMRPTPGVLSNQAETSRDLQARLTKATEPFSNRGGAATLPTGVHDSSTEGQHYNVVTGVNAQPQSLAGKHVGCANTGETNWAASGDSKPGGYNSINSGFPTRGAQRQSGRPGSRNSNTSSRENSRMRQTPGGF
jgi:hypothetical protein